MLANSNAAKYKTITICSTDINDSSIQLVEERSLDNLDIAVSTLKK